MTNHQTAFTADMAGKRLHIVRYFDAPREKVWKAWTQPELLDQWWAPQPWQAKTKEMDFREGGHWLYVMAGPDGEESWSQANFHKIDPPKSFTATDCFCNEQGDKIEDMPTLDWQVRFLEAGSGTEVRVDIALASEADMQQILEMGFEEGFASAHGNLDSLLKQLAA